MQNATELLSTYKSVHLNHSNLATHCVGIPLIIMSILIVLHLIKISLGSLGMLPLSIPFLLAVTIYYFVLNRALAIGAIGFTLILYGIAWLLSSSAAPWWMAAGLFTIGWLLQFVGHYYEKAKPAFFEDVKQLLIGPFFLIAELYFVLGFQPTTRTEIAQKAQQKRHQIDANTTKPS